DGEAASSSLNQMTLAGEDNAPLASPTSNDEEGEKEQQQSVADLIREANGEAPASPTKRPSRHERATAAVAAEAERASTPTQALTEDEVSSRAAMLLQNLRGESSTPLPASTRRGRDEERRARRRARQGSTNGSAGGSALSLSLSGTPTLASALGSNDDGEEESRRAKELLL